MLNADKKLMMLEQVKDSLITQEGIRYDRFRRSLSSASLHINRNQLQQLYNTLPTSQMKNYQLPTISSKNKTMGSDEEKSLVPTNQENKKSIIDQDNIR